MMVPILCNVIDRKSKTSFNIFYLELEYCKEFTGFVEAIRSVACNYCSGHITNVIECHFRFFHLLFNTNHSPLRSMKWNKVDGRASESSVGDWYRLNLWITTILSSQLYVRTERIHQYFVLFDNTSSFELLYLIKSVATFSDSVVGCKISF